MFNDEQYRRDANAFIVQQQREREQRERDQREREQREKERKDRERQVAEQNYRDRKAFEKQQEEARKKLEASFRSNHDSIFNSSSYSSSTPYNYNNEEQGCLGKLFSLIWSIIFYSAVFYFGGWFVLGILIEATQPPRPLPVECSSVMRQEWEISQKKWEARKQYWYDEYHIKLENVNHSCKILNQHRINFGKGVYYYWTIVRDRCKKNIRLFFDELNRREESTKEASTSKRPEIPKR